jgi:Protein of unknown function (DUF2778)
MWTYEQRTGVLRHNGEAVGTGYAGIDTVTVQGKNNPEAQDVPDVGPLPVGFYAIGPAHKEPILGAVAMRLTPDPANQMFGRGGFFIHADAIQHPGFASHGCIVLCLALRNLIAASGDTDLQVVVE